MDRIRELWELASAHTEALVVMKSKQLIGKAGWTPDDLLDIRQSLRMSVWKSLRLFDPACGPIEAHVTVVVESAVKMLLRDRRALKRGGGRQPLSLDDGGSIADKARQILDGRGSPERRTGIDAIRRACAELPPDLRQVAVMRARMSISEIARLTGRRRRDVRDALAFVRTHLEGRGIDEDF